MQILFHFLLFFATAYLVFGLFVLFKNLRSASNTVFFLICVNLCLWALGYAYMVVAPTSDVANMWRLVSTIGWCFIYANCLDFILLVTTKNTKWKTDFRRLFIYIPAVLIYIINIPHKPTNIRGIWVDVNPVNLSQIIFIIFYVTYTIISIVIIYFWRKRALTHREKAQTKIIIVTSLTSFVLATITDSILPLFGFVTFPYGIFTLSIACFGMWWSITKYRMLSISTAAANDYILKTINEPVVIVGKDFLIKETNAAMFQLTGYKIEEVQDKPLINLVESNLPQLPNLLELLKSGPIKNQEVFLKTKFENNITCLLSGAAIYDEFSDILGYACVFYDITERKRTEELLVKAHLELETKVLERTSQLRYSQDKFMTFMKQAADAIIVFDPHTLQILECNEMTCKIMERTEEAICNLTLRELLPWQSDFITEQSPIFLQKGKPIYKELFVYTIPDRLPGYYEYSLTNLGFEDESYVMMTFSDVTEKHLMEERKQNMAKMESLGTLAGGIAHDFNNILAGIMGYTQLSLEELEDRPEIAHNLQEVLKLGNRSKKLISQILNFSRRIPENQKNVEVAGMIEEVVKLLRATISKNIEIKTYFDSEQAYVYADGAEIHQLIMNLCVNAEKALGKNETGTIEIHLSERTLKNSDGVVYDGLSEGHYLQIVVKDSGCGMDEVVMNRIFEPFYSTRLVEGGTGLGLSVVHGIVSRYKGVISVESEVNYGSTFTILLPASSCKWER